MSVLHIAPTIQQRSKGYLSTGHRIATPEQHRLSQYRTSFFRARYPQFSIRTSDCRRGLVAAYPISVPDTA
eukprot:563130-Rhodomonas_salina.2